MPGTFNFNVEKNGGMGTRYMNGWYRLWVVIVALLGATFAYQAWSTWPSAASVSHDEALIQQISPAARAYLAQSDEDAGIQVRHQNGYVMVLKHGVEKPPVEDPVRQYNNILINAAGHKQKELVIRTLLSWLALSLALLVAGHTVGWVIRGFARSEPPQDSQR